MLKCGKLKEDMKAKFEKEKLEELGYLIFEFPMGSGGVKQIKELENAVKPFGIEKGWNVFYSIDEA